MKKMFLVAAATVIATVSFSQAKFGFQAIGNASTASLKGDNLAGFKKSTKIGFGGGIVADLPVAKNFSVRPSLNFLQKKSSLVYTGVTNQKFTTESELNYLELPVNFVYKVPLQAASVYFGAGPSVGYGISGKIKSQGVLPGDNEQINDSSDPFKEVEGETLMKRVDVSANFLAGVEFNNGIFVNAGYLLGLTNISKNQDGGYKNRGILLTVGFMF